MVNNKLGNYSSFVDMPPTPPSTAPQNSTAKPQPVLNTKLQEENSPECAPLIDLLNGGKTEEKSAIASTKEGITPIVANDNKGKKDRLDNGQFFMGNFEITYKTGDGTPKDIVIQKNIRGYFIQNNPSQSNNKNQWNEINGRFFKNKEDLKNALTKIVGLQDIETIDSLKEKLIKTGDFFTAGLNMYYFSNDGGIKHTVIESWRDLISVQYSIPDPNFESVSGVKFESMAALRQALRIGMGMNLVT